jgi:preprotein translocase subunit SecD
MGVVRDNWRIAMLVAFLLASTFALFGPIGGGAGTQTDLVGLSEDENTIDVTESSIILENSTLETTNDTENTIVASDASISIDGNVSDVTDTSATVVDGSIDISGGSVVSPANTSAITAGNRSITVDGQATLRTVNSSVDVSVERAAETGLTNLQYGLDLSGGTRIRAPIVGLHATDLSFSGDTSQVSQQVATELGVDEIDVQVRTRDGTVEVFDGNVTKSSFASALQSAGFDVQRSDVQTGVTSSTRDTVVNTLQGRIDQTGLAGGSVTTAGDGLIVVEVPNTTPEQVRDIVTDRGVVRIVAEVEENGEKTNTTVLTGDDIAETSPIGQRESGGWEVPVTVTEGAAPKFQQEMNDLGFTSGNGIGNCDRTRSAGPGSYCLLTMLDGEIVRPNSMGDGLAGGLRDGTWAERRGFTIGAESADQAQDIKLSLDVGSLPTTLNLSQGAQFDVSYIEPSYAQEFKPLSVVTGLLAWFAVAGMIFWRYREIRVAIPMLFTAIAEVYILLGFAAFSGLALDLSHIAGLIAVIGTGVDDLVIMADEILQQGKVATGRVFQSRFRKAFWVIGAAAATTIIAMTPLTILSVGDLFGFAIITIVGVLVGVLITRPAYGDILRYLVLSEDQR